MIVRNKLYARKPRKYFWFNQLKVWEGERYPGYNIVREFLQN